MRRILRWLLPFLWQTKSNRIATVTTLLLIAAEATITWMLPQKMGQFILSLNAKTQHTLQHTLLAAGLVGGLWTCNKILQHLQHLIFFRVINSTIRIIRLQVVLKLHEASSTRSQHYTTATITNSARRVSGQLRKVMEGAFLWVFPAIVKLLVSILFILIHYPAMAYFPVFVTLSTAYFGWSMHEFLQARLKSWKATDKVIAAMTDSLDNAQFAKFHPQAEAARLQPVFDRESRCWWRSNTLKHTFKIKRNLVFGIGYTVGIMHTAYWLWSAYGTAGIPKKVAEKAATLLQHMRKTSCNMRTIAHQTRVMGTAFLDLYQVLEILSWKRPTVTHLTAPSSPTGKPLIALHKASFAYQSGTTPLLKGIDLQVYPGQKIGLVGSSGAGKSTLCKLLCGFYQPSSGVIQIKNIPTHAWQPAVLGKFLHLVAQDAPILSGSIADNLMAPEAAVDPSPMGYLADRMHQQVGERGSQLSGGEKQRILLARCLAYKPEILILDESLSTLDEASAQALLRTIMQRVPTLIFATHRHSLLQDFETVYQLQQGRLKQTKITPWPDALQRRTAEQARAQTA